MGITFKRVVSLKWGFPGSSAEKAMAPHSSTLAWKIPWMEEPGRLQSMRSLRVGHDWATSCIFHFHALEKEMATHSSILAWRIPGTGEPGGLLSMGLHRVWHDKRLSSSSNNNNNWHKKLKVRLLDSKIDKCNRDFQINRSTQQMYGQVSFSSKCRMMH